MKKFSLKKGFTLIELLVVIAVLGILSVGLIAAIDPVDKSNAAGDARVLSDVGVIARALESYATSQGGYPAALSDLTTSTTQELKSIPVPPTGQCGATNTYDGGTNCDFIPSPEGCVSGACTSAVITAPLKSKKYTATPFWRYESSTGKSCAVANATTACPST